MFQPGWKRYCLISSIPTSKQRVGSASSKQFKIGSRRVSRPLFGLRRRGVGHKTGPDAPWKSMGCALHGWHSISSSPLANWDHPYHDERRVRWVPVSKQCVVGDNQSLEITFSNALTKHFTFASIMLMFGTCIVNELIDVLGCKKRREGASFGCNVHSCRKLTIFRMTPNW